MEVWDWFGRIGGRGKGEFLKCLESVKEWMVRVAEAFDYDTWVKSLPATIDLLRDFMGDAG